MFAYTTLSFEDSLFQDLAKKSFLDEESFSHKEEVNWKDNLNRLPARKLSWLDTKNSPYVREKLLKILAGEVLILKQQ